MRAEADKLGVTVDELFPRAIMPTYHPVIEWGPSQWKKIHSQREPTKEWFDEWLKDILTASCECGIHWASILKTWPPDFTSPKAFFDWSWKVHNLVNEHLGKPQFSYEAACQLYSVPPSWANQAGKLESWSS